MAFVCVAGGVTSALVMVAGLVWTALGGGRLVYSAEQAEEYEAAGAALHAATGGHSYESGHDHESGHDAPATATDRKAAVASAHERFDRAQAALNAARFAQHRLGPWLVCGGLAGVLAFGVGYLAVREEYKESR